MPADEVDGLRRRIEELEGALASRVIIEQAKGIVAVRDRVAIDVAFERLRRLARTSRRPLRNVAAEVVARHEASGVLSRR